MIDVGVRAYETGGRASTSSMGAEDAGVPGSGCDGCWVVHADFGGVGGQKVDSGIVVGSRLAQTDWKILITLVSPNL